MIALAFSSTEDPAHATAQTWKTGGTSGNWNDGTKWTSGNAPATTDTVTFNATSQNGAETIYLNGGQTIAGMTFANTGTTSLLGGVSGTAAANTLTLGASGLTVNNTAGAVTIGDTSASPTAQVNLALSASQSFSNASATVLTIANGVTSSASTGTQTLTVSGAGNGGETFDGVLANGTAGGTLALLVNSTATTGTTTLVSANTFSGGTTLTRGIILVENSTTTSGGVITSGPLGTGVFALNGSGTLTDNGTALTIANSVFPRGRYAGPGHAGWR